MAHNEVPNTSDMNYVPLMPYKGTEATGGDSKLTNLNVYYEVSKTARERVRSSSCQDRGLTKSCPVGRYCLDAHGHSACLAHDSRCRVRSPLKYPMRPRCTVSDIFDSFFYSGLARRKSALSLIWLSIMAAALISFQWFFWGYSLAFSHSAGRFIGDLTNFGFRNVLGQPSVGSPRIPDLLFAVYQGMFAAVTYVTPLITFVVNDDRVYSGQPD